MKINKLIMLMIVMSLIMTSCFAIETRRVSLASYHSLATNNEFEVLWNIPDIFMDDSDRWSNMVGAPRKIIINGWKSGDVITRKFIGLDSISSNIAWTIPGGGSIISEGETLYRGTDGTARIQSYNIENGELLWDTLLPWAHSTIDLYFAENKIFVNTGDDEFFILNRDGAILDTFHQNRRTLLAMNDVLYVEGTSSIKALDFSSRKELWQLRLDNYYTYAPIFDNGAIFLRTSASIYSIDQSTGKVNWKFSQDPLSNLYVAGEKIYFISLDGYLVTVDRKSGDEISKIKFSPSFN